MSGRVPLAEKALSESYARLRYRDTSLLIWQQQQQKLASALPGTYLSRSRSMWYSQYGNEAILVRDRNKLDVSRDTGQSKFCSIIAAGKGDPPHWQLEGTPGNSQHLQAPWLGSACHADLCLLPVAHEILLQDPPACTKSLKTPTASALIYPEGLSGRTRPRTSGWAAPSPTPSPCLDYKVYII
ncbi:hypothetical protein R6Z07F_003656 [Ovis aries]